MIFAACLQRRMALSTCRAVFGFLKQTVCHNPGNHNGILNCDRALLPVKVLDLATTSGSLSERALQQIGEPQAQASLIAHQAS